MLLASMRSVPYLKSFEDIYVNFYNHTFLKDEIAVNCRPVSDALEVLAKSGKSIIRWGDGESFVMMGCHIRFQKSSSRLRKRMLEVVTHYSDEAAYHLCIPANFLTIRTNDLKKVCDTKGNYYQLHKRTRYVFTKFFNRHASYLPHQIFKDSVRNRMPDLVDLFSKYRAFVVVKDNPDVVNGFFGTYLKNKHKEFVRIPPRHAFEEYDRILEAIIEKASRIDCAPGELLILLSAGPCAKVLTYDLAQKGYTAYDIGKLMEQCARHQRTPAPSRILEGLTLSE